MAGFKFGFGFGFGFAGGILAPSALFTFLPALTPWNDAAMWSDSVNWSD